MQQIKLIADDLAQQMSYYVWIQFLSTMNQIIREVRKDNYINHTFFK